MISKLDIIKCVILVTATIWFGPAVESGMLSNYPTIMSLVPIILVTLVFWTAVELIMLASKIVKIALKKES